jgi:hypothetical protein
VAASHGDRPGGRRDRREPAVAESDGVLADLQDRRQAGLFGAGHDGLGVLDGDGVDRWQRDGRGPAADRGGRVSLEGDPPRRR